MKSKAPFWKWLLCITGGFILFVIIYGIFQGLSMTGPIWLQAVMRPVSAAVIMALFALWVKKVERKSTSMMLTHKAVQQLGKGFLTGILFFIAVTAVFFISGMAEISFTNPSWAYIGMNLLLYLVVACAEEVIFRGVLFRMIDERFGMWPALVITGLMFGFVHISNPGATVSSSLAISVEAGIMLGAAFKYTGSLWLPVGIHWAWNFTQGNVFGLSVSGGALEESIFRTTLSGPDVLTGGAFGPEGSVITACLGLLLSVYFIWKTKTA